MIFLRFYLGSIFILDSCESNYERNKQNKEILFIIFRLENHREGYRLK